MKSKICVKCNKSKKLNEFNKNNGNKDKHRYDCRVCEKKRKGDRIKCECGCEIRRDYVAAHKRTNKHKIYLSTQ